MPRILTLAAFGLLAATTSLNAQQLGGAGGGGTGIGGGGTGIGGGGTGIGGGGGGGGSSFGGGGGGNTGTGGQTFSGGFTLGSAGGGQAGANTASSIATSNFLRNSFGNPQYQGRAGANLNQAPGGFGQPLYTGGTGATGGTGGTRTGGTATAGSTQIGGNAAGGRVGGGGTATGGRGIASPTSGTQIAIAFEATPKFRVAPADPVRLQNSLRNVLDRSTTLRNPQSIQVAVVDGTVILSGRVSSEDEARLVEGMIRLTPGVRNLQNDLVADAAPSTP